MKRHPGKICLMQIFAITLLLAGCRSSDESKNEISKVQHRNHLERQGRSFVIQGDYDLAIESYKRALDPTNINDEHEKSTAMAALCFIYKAKNDYDKALQYANWFLRDNNQNETAVIAKAEIESTIRFRDSGESEVVVRHIDSLKSKYAQYLPPQGYISAFSPIEISNILRLYDTIGDYDAGIAFIDEILVYFRSGKAGDHKPGWVDMEYLKVREGFELDKKEAKKGSMREGKPGRATLVMIKSEYFPW